MVQLVGIAGRDAADLGGDQVKRFTLGIREQRIFRRAADGFLDALCHHCVVLVVSMSAGALDNDVGAAPSATGLLSQRRRWRAKALVERNMPKAWPARRRLAPK